MEDFMPECRNGMLRPRVGHFGSAGFWKCMSLMHVFADIGDFDALRFCESFQILARLENERICGFIFFEDSLRVSLGQLQGQFRSRLATSLAEAVPPLECPLVISP